MKRNLYTLLVGIDDYPQPTRALVGCVNDTKAFQEYLRARLETDEFNLREKVLLNKEATYEAIIDGFESHLSQATARDVVVFYFSGHGSKEPCPEEFWYLEPDKMNETLVCCDSRPDGRDLADKELAKLIARVARNSPHFVVVLDCCHAGSGTRAETPIIRGVPPREDVRPLDSYWGSPAEVAAPFRARNIPGDRGEWTELPRGNHVLLAACRDNQFAKEYLADGVPRGAFSYFLLNALQVIGGNLSYEHLMKAVAALLRRNVSDQTPQLEVIEQEELDQPFLGGAINERSVSFTASFDNELGWIVDAGSLHGIPADSVVGATQFALFPMGASRPGKLRLSNASGIADATEVRPHFCRVNVVGLASDAPTSVFNAILVRAPLASFGVRMKGDEEALELAREAIKSSSGLGGESLYVREAHEDARLVLSARDGKYSLCAPGNYKPLTSALTGYTQPNAALAIKRLEHIARWKTIKELSNPASELPSNAIRITAHSGGKEIRGRWVRLEYQYKDGKWTPPKMRLRLSNRSGESLYCALLMLSERFAIEPGFFPAGGIWLDKDQEAWSDLVYGRVPDRLWAQGITQTRDSIKLIFSFEEFDPRLLRQGELDTPFDREAHRGVVVVNTLNRFMNGIMTRELSTRPEEDEVYADWCANSIIVTTVRPLLSTVDNCVDGHFLKGQ